MNFPTVAVISLSWIESERKSLNAESLLCVCFALLALETEETQTDMSVVLTPVYFTGVRHPVMFRSTNLSLSTFPGNQSAFYIQP